MFNCLMLLHNSLQSQFCAVSELPRTRVPCERFHGCWKLTLRFNILTCIKSAVWWARRSYCPFHIHEAWRRLLLQSQNLVNLNWAWILIKFSFEIKGRSCSDDSFCWNQSSSMPVGWTKENLSFVRFSKLNFWYLAHGRHFIKPIVRGFCLSFRLHCPRTCIEGEHIHHWHQTHLGIVEQRTVTAVTSNTIRVKCDFATSCGKLGFAVKLVERFDCTIHIGKQGYSRRQEFACMLKAGAEARTEFENQC